EVQSAPSREYGRAMLTVVEPSDPLMQGVPSPTQVWMSHGDTACRLPIAPRKHIIAFCYLLPGGRMSVRDGAISPEDIDFGGDSPL
ncbi:hypothetical protein PZH44_12175, partial [Alistipes putredinis]|nr:hypothetical protein [Alistipes putredinis]